MLKIRLQRVGRRNNPAFRVVVTERTRGPKSAYLESLGSYNPHTNTTTLDTERVKHWLSVGAQASPTVHNILISEKVIEGKKINVLPRKSPIVKESEQGETKAEEAPVSAETTEEEPATEEEAEKEEGASEEAKAESPKSASEENAGRDEEKTEANQEEATQ